MTRRDFDPDATFEAIRSKQGRKASSSDSSRAVKHRRKARRVAARKAKLGLERP
jgi:hypothetical protein